MFSVLYLLVSRGCACAGLVLEAGPGWYAWLALVLLICAKCLTTQFCKLVPQFLSATFGPDVAVLRGERDVKKMIQNYSSV